MPVNVTTNETASIPTYQEMDTAIADAVAQISTSPSSDTSVAPSDDWPAIVEDASRRGSVGSRPTVTFQDGTYTKTDKQINLAGPVILKAANMGQATLNCGFYTQGTHVRIDGFDWTPVSDIRCLTAVNAYVDLDDCCATALSGHTNYSGQFIDARASNIQVRAWNRICRFDFSQSAEALIARLLYGSFMFTTAGSGYYVNWRHTTADSHIMQLATSGGHLADSRFDGAGEGSASSALYMIRHAMVDCFASGDTGGAPIGFFDFGTGAHVQKGSHLFLDGTDPSNANKHWQLIRCNRGIDAYHGGDYRYDSNTVTFGNNVATRKWTDNSALVGT